MVSLVNCELSITLKLCEVGSIFVELFCINYSQFTLFTIPKNMFLNLNHQKLNVYISSRKLLIECNRFAKHLPEEERYSMRSQIRRAALSVQLNIAEGASRKSELERKRFYEISRGSLIEIDAALDAATDLDYIGTYDTTLLGAAITNTFRLLSGLIKS